MYDQCNSLHATRYTSDYGPCDTITCFVVLEGHEVRVVNAGTTQNAALKTVFVYMYTM
jgi:hypothetical protein